MVRLSDRVQSIPSALSIYMNQLVYDRKRAGLPVTTLSLGEAFFDIPPLDFSSIPAEKAFHYADSKGIPELRKRICTYYHRQYGVTVDPD
jgi:aspartate/methionine/tyrosine aminotransferase